MVSTLRYRVKDVGDALQATGRLPAERIEGVIDRLVTAADHVGSAAAGVRMAELLADGSAIGGLVSLLGQSPEVLDMAALTLGAISAHSAIDLCAAAVATAVTGVPAPGGRESSVPSLAGAVGKGRIALPAELQTWLATTCGARYDELEEWRDPQTHRVVRRGLVGARTASGELERQSVQVYRRCILNGSVVDELLGAATDVLPRFHDLAEERFLAATIALRSTYAPGWRR